MRNIHLSMPVAADGFLAGHQATIQFLRGCFQPGDAVKIDMTGLIMLYTAWMKLFMEILEPGRLFFWYGTRIKLWSIFK